MIAAQYAKDARKIPAEELKLPEITL